MAVLNKIRQRSVFLIIIIALALFSFVLADVLKSGGFSSQKSQRVLAVVNGQEIDQQDFARKVEVQTSRYGSAMTTTRAMNAVWDQELRSLLLDDQLEELGITIEQDRLNNILKDALQEDPRFQNEDGTFSESKMREFVATLKSTNQDMYNQWVEYENQLAKGEKERIYFNLVKAGVGATLKEGKLAYEMENNTRDIEYVQVPYSSIPDEDVEVTKDDVQKYINAHKEDYQTEATRNLRFVKFQEKATLGDENQVKDEVAAFLNSKVAYNAAAKINDTVTGFAKTATPEEFVNEYSDLRFDDRFFFKDELPAAIKDSIFDLNVGDVYGPYKDNGFYKVSRVVAVKQLPDSVKASHILLTYAGLQNAGAETRTKAQAKTLADSLAAVIKSNPSKLAELAPEYSADGGSRDKGGELGYAPKNMYVQPFNDFIFEGEKGDIGVVESNFGYHIIHIEDQKNKQRAIKVATVAKAIEPSQKTINDVFTTTTKFEMSTNADKQKFSEIAKDSNYVVRPVNGVKILDENIPGEGSQREIVRWAFEDDTNTGDIKRFQVEDGYLVVQLTKKGEKGLMSVEDASARVTPLVRNEKKAELIKNKISGTDLQAIAKNQNVTVQTASALNLKNPTIAGAGTEPKVVGAVFSLKEGQVSAPIVGDRGVYVAKVTKVNPAAAMDNYTSFAMQQTSANRAAVSNNVVQALKDEADIDDRRSNFY